MDRLLDKPRVLIVDIGGFTADYLMMRSGRADLSICDSLENGVILLYNRNGRHSMDDDNNGLLSDWKSGERSPVKTSLIMMVGIVALALVIVIQG